MNIFYFIGCKIKYWWRVILFYLGYREKLYISNICVKNIEIIIVFEFRIFLLEEITIFMITFPIKYFRGRIFLIAGQP